MNFLILLNPNYWFTIEAPLVTGLMGNVLFGVFALCFLLGIVTRVVASNRTKDLYVQKLGQRAGTLFVTMGLLGVVLFFFSYERIQFFGGRFWYPLWLVGLIVWLLVLVRYARRDIPAMRERDMNRKSVSKYLPAKKKKRKKKR
ncbi:hypothetical protein CO174_04635 [Candidatus Uhrbacteria bacterium CG_4_9_14_3_um_filter_50_9]|uniref:Uncharacterized protein n=1 Tax=Candidatus Uhrbacteria bacterium CG_4_9_14_3_um_filter_50_9 TaxID=1975035 RepID=A0A2M7XB69_9BACT|nr:MAG: hypothetical protein CO174_04635 [Candidatus Uhrbacteria bacterium CG_4_9_14_3_um_filter_50_9]